MTRARTALIAFAVLLCLVVGLAPSATANIVKGSACSGSTDHWGWDYKMEHRYAPGTWCISDPHTGARMVWQKDGNLVVYTGANIGGTAQMASHTNGIVGVMLKFQKDGNVVVSDQHGKAIFTALTPSLHRPPGTYRLFVSKHEVQTTWNNTQVMRRLAFPGAPACMSVIVIRAFC